MTRTRMNNVRLDFHKNAVFPLFRTNTGVNNYLSKKASNEEYDEISEKNFYGNGVIRIRVGKGSVEKQTRLPRLVEKRAHESNCK